MSLDDNQLQALRKGFWQEHDRFLKSTLVTEQPHPRTEALSSLAQKDLAQAIAILKEIDLGVLQTLKQDQNQFIALQQAIIKTFEQKGRVFICGCGATGRLAVSLEVLFRRRFPDLSGSVFGLIAGGDTALIRSIEKFEDRKDFGIRQLQEAGFEKNDLLLSASAGGESPFVLGAVEYAAINSEHKPWLLYCNPDPMLIMRNANHPSANPNIISWSLVVGPMALTGSTRMQATTAMMAAIGLPLLNWQENLNVHSEIQKFIACLQAADFGQLQNFISKEAQAYENKEPVLYVSDENSALTVLTDTTERSPTFNLPPFDNRIDQSSQSSNCYLMLQEKPDAKAAWYALLQRTPHALNWPDAPITSTDYLYGYDFSEQVRIWRHHPKNHEFMIQSVENKILWQFENGCAQFDTMGLSLFWQQLLLKLLLNIHSTLVMGKLGLYEGNLMTSLNPSNYKLIDRAIRYTRYRYQSITGKDLSYEIIAEAVFAELARLKPGQSIVHNAIRRVNIISSNGA